MSKLGIQVIMARRSTAFIALFVMIGCSPNCRNSDGEGYPVDSWYAPPPYVEREDLKKVDELCVHAVKSEMQDLAEEMLSKTPFVELDLPLAKSLIGGHLCKPSERKVFLCRGLSYRQYGAFDAYFIGDALWIEHDTLGKEFIPMKRRAVVVELDRAPRKLYVSSRIDE